MVDYYLDCIDNCTSIACRDAGLRCFADGDCGPYFSGSCGGTTSCPAPLPNSHLVYSTCSCEPVTDSSACRDCRKTHIIGRCRSSVPCKATGTCAYECDPGYVWNGSECVPAVVKPIQIIGDSISSIIV